MSVLSESHSGCRIIGIRHRTKKTAENEARPTQVVIVLPGESEATQYLDLALETEMDELDFALGKFPVTYRAIIAKDDVSAFPAHHVKYRKLKAGESESQFPESWIRYEGKNAMVASKIPTGYEGLRPGDKVAMILGL